MAYTNGKYPLNLNDPRWKEADFPERTELCKCSALKGALPIPTGRICVINDCRDYRYNRLYLFSINQNLQPDKHLMNSQTPGKR